MPLLGKYCDVALKSNGFKGNLCLENATSALTGGSFEKKNENEKGFHAKRKKLMWLFQVNGKKGNGFFFCYMLKKEYINTKHQTLKQELCVFLPFCSIVYKTTKRLKIVEN